MDFARIFQSFPSEGFAPGRRVQPSPLTASLCAGGSNAYPIYPERQHLLEDREVLDALELAKEGVEAGALVAALAARRPDRPAWRAQVAVAWMLKHWLLE